MKKNRFKQGSCEAELNLIVPGIEFAKEILRPRLYNAAVFLDLIWECDVKYMADNCIYTIKIKGKEEDIELFGDFVEKIIDYNSELLH